MWRRDEKSRSVRKERCATPFPEWGLKTDGSTTRSIPTSSRPKGCIDWPNGWTLGAPRCVVRLWPFAEPKFAWASGARRSKPAVRSPFGIGAVLGLCASDAGKYKVRPCFLSVKMDSTEHEFRANPSPEHVETLSLLSLKQKSENERTRLHSQQLNSVCPETQFSGTCHFEEQTTKQSHGFTLFREPSFF